MILAQLKKGFTLVEIMIVLALIGILAAGIIPGVTSYLARGRDSNRLFEMKQINNAIVQSQVGNRTFKVTGLSGSGQGWVNTPDNGNTITMVKALENKGFLKNGIPDIATVDKTAYPVATNMTPCVTSTNSRDLYMYFFDDSTGKYSLSGYMENQLQPNIDNVQLSYNGTGATGTCTFHGRNYALGIN